MNSRAVKWSKKIIEKHGPMGVRGLIGYMKDAGLSQIPTQSKLSGALRARPDLFGHAEEGVWKLIE